MVLVCGWLEDNGRVLFLIRKNNNIEQIELPCFEASKNSEFVYELAKEYQKQTGIDAEILGIIKKARYNVGSRRKKRWDDVLVFEVKAKNKTARPSVEFSGFKWLSLETAKKQKLNRKFEWLRQ